MCLQENNNPPTVQACKPEFIHTEELSYKYEERNSTWWPGTNRNTGSKCWISPMSTSHGRLRKSTFPSPPMREEVHWAVCRHLSSAVAPLVFRELWQLAPIIFLLFPGPECVAVCPPASGGSGVPTGHLSSWPQCMNVHEEFPLTFIIPGTTVNSWLGNWANLLELFISQVLFF